MKLTKGPIPVMGERKLQAMKTIAKINNIFFYSFRFYPIFGPNNQSCRFYILYLIK